ncbi:MAG: hypothetical protein PHR96_03090 [Clostridia bacterium]|nr:hypothetical protein [Clostridia bacterium]
MDSKIKNRNLFSEDARKWRKWMLLFTIIFYICLMIFVFLIIFPNNFINQYVPEIKKTLFIIGFLILAVLSNCAYASKYLKYYMFIDEKNMIFFANNKSHKYNLGDLLSYKIIKSLHKYSVYELKFVDGNKYILSSFKASYFTKILEMILEDNVKHKI